MFNSRRIKYLEEETESLSRLVDRLFYEVDEMLDEILALKKTISPAKAPKKRGKKTVIDFGKPYGGLPKPTKRKYVKSGKYAKKPIFDPEYFKQEIKKPAKKVTTKKK